MDVQKTTINALRILSAEAIDKAKSGHPGLPMGCAPIAYTLFQNFLKFFSKDIAFYINICYNICIWIWGADFLCFWTSLTPFFHTIIFKGVFMWNEHKTGRIKKHFEVL